MKKPHKHAELIKAWADGAKIQARDSDGWKDVYENQPSWLDCFEFRIKPEPKSEETKEKYLYLNWQDGENKWFITAAPFQCTKFKFKVEQV